MKKLKCLWLLSFDCKTGKSKIVVGGTKVDFNCNSRDSVNINDLLAPEQYQENALTRV